MLRVPVVIALALATAIVATAQARPQRIVSLIPAVTEILFAIGAGPQVVAVSSFDEYPPEVKSLTRVGALLDPNLEKILSLRPDLVAVYGSQEDLSKQLAKADVPVYVYRHAGLADVTRTISELGARTGHVKEAAGLTARLDEGMAQLARKVAGRARPRTMVVFGRESGSLRSIYASGGYGFVHDMLTAAGGENVFADVKKENVQATSELVLARKPDVILELRADPMSADQIRTETESWSTLAAVPAVRNRRVIFIVDQRTVVPGPRIVEGAELMARALHPDAFPAGR